MENLRVPQLLILVLVAGLISSYMAMGQVSFTTDEAHFTMDNLGLMVQNFLAATPPPNSLVTCSAPVNSNSNNAYFAPGDILPGIEFSDNPGPGVNGIDVIVGEYGCSQIMTVSIFGSADNLLGLSDVAVVLGLIAFVMLRRKKAAA